MLIVLGIAATPGSQLDLALPDNSTAPEESEARQTYDKITAAFGAGYNSPLSVTANIITSTDPTKTVDDLATKVSEVPDVVAIMQATPNPGADTGLVALVPKDGQTAPSTARLVQELRDRGPDWEQELGVTDVLVAGTTAVNIDVSKKLADALLPFAAIVIGLSIVLLMIVFRSIAVPIKATLGYLLSVGAALGAVVAAFQWGWLDPVMGEAAGPIVSFLPIFVMGVLFGLAMDYEMFLVSAMREDYVVTGDPKAAIIDGFKASSKVVTAAAAIMTSVFIAFIPGGSSTIKPIALGLAVGRRGRRLHRPDDAGARRLDDARQVGVVAARPGWRGSCPRSTSRVRPCTARSPTRRGPPSTGPTALYARGLVLTEGADALDVVAPAGAVTRLVVPDGTDERRARPRPGRPDPRGLGRAGRRRAAAARAARAGQPGGHGGRPGSQRDATPSSRPAIRATARLSSSSRRAQREHVDRTVALVGELDAAIGPGSPHTMRSAVVEAAQAVAGGVATVVVAGLDDLLLAQDRYRAERLADALAARGIGVVLLLTHADHARDLATDGRPEPAARDEDQSREDESQEETKVHD